MAEQLNDKKVQMGVIIPVRNLNPKTGSASVYYALKIEHESGDENTEAWLMFTERELLAAPVYNMGNYSKGFKKGRAYEATGKKYTGRKYFIKIDIPGNEPGTYDTTILYVSNTWIQKGLARAAKNPEDIPNEGWWEDLKD